jgi:hypothetical protein
MIGTAVYVGYNVTQRAPEEAEGHSIPIELEALNQYETIQLFSKPNILAIPA